jgi:hypothetical protein
VVSAPSRLGPTARAALDLPLRGAKRRRLLGLLAVAADRGLRSPSIGELSRASGYPRALVVSLIDSLERDGLLVVDRTDTGEPHNRRATYFLSLDNHPKGPTHTMSTKTTNTEPTEEAPVAPSPPSWQREGFWPQMTRVPWPALVDAGAKHDAAAAAVADARAAGDIDAERAGLLSLADSLIAADRELRRTFAEAQQAFQTEASGVTPYRAGDRVPDDAITEHRKSIAEAREWIEHDRDVFEKVSGLLEERVFVADFLRHPTEADHVATAVSDPVARATVLKRELAT